MSNILILDTATSEMNYGIVVENNLHCKNHAGDRDSFVASVMDEVERHIQVSSIDTVIVIHGPGMFTGIRIGCLMANALKMALGGKLQIFTIDTLTAQVPPDMEGQCFSLARAGKHEFYYATFRDAQMEGDIDVVTVEGIKSDVSQIYVSEDCTEAFPGAQTVDGQTRIAHAFARYSKGLLASVDRVLPLYVKPPNITIKKHT